MTVTLDVLVLPAFEDLAGLPGETTPWERTYEFDGRLDIDGVRTPVRYTGGGLGLVPTGIGKANAAATTTALLASDRIDLSETLLLTVGVAGAPPSVPVGSVVISERIVDWDDKCRFDRDGERRPLEMNPYTEGQGLYELDSELVEDACRCGSAVDLEGSENGGPDSELLTGTNLCGDELWHGRELAAQAEWLVGQYDAGPYRITEMEDAGTAAALDRFDRLDQYCVVRGVSNHDRPGGEESARESFFSDEFEDGFEIGIKNAVTVARAIVENRQTTG